MRTLAYYSIIQSVTRVAFLVECAKQLFNARNILFQKLRHNCNQSRFCLVGFLTSSSTTRLYRGRAPRQERLTILRAATHETELGDHDFCLSRSHYTDTDPTCRERAATAGIEPGTSSPGVARSTAELPRPPNQSRPPLQKSKLFQICRATLWTYLSTCFRSLIRGVFLSSVSGVWLPSAHSVVIVYETSSKRYVVSENRITDPYSSR